MRSRKRFIKEEKGSMYDLMRAVEDRIYDLEDDFSESLDEAVSEDDVRELTLFIPNAAPLNTVIKATIDNLKRKIKRGVYDEDKAIKAWENIADAGVKLYDKWYGSGRGSLTMIDKPTRHEIAIRLMNDYDEQVHEDDVQESLRLRDEESVSIHESEDEIARKGFCSLVKDSFYGGYIVLNDGYFVCKISATDDSDAERQFYDFLKTDWKADWKNGTLPRYYDESPKDYAGNPINYFENKKRRQARKQISESAWTAPNGKKYGKQGRDRKTGRYLFTKKELKDMIDSGIAKAISDAEQAWKMSDEVIGYSWNYTNGFKSGILFTDKDGNLWVGNTGVAQMFL